MKKKTILILINPFFITMMIILISYNFFIKNFENIEEEQNFKNIKIVLNIIDEEFKRVDKTAKDYSEWDETYNFIENRNEKYIYENFRDGTTTLEGLDIDFMIFTDKNNNKVFSKFLRSEQKKNKIDFDTKENFEKKLLSNFNEEKALSDIHSFEKSKILKLSKAYFIVTKRAISTSDNKAPTNGFLYVGYKISNNTLYNMNNVFTKVELEDAEFDKNDFLIDSKFLKNIKVYINKNDSCKCIKNNLQIYDRNGNYVVSILTEGSRDIFNKGKETIFYYNLVIFFFLFIIFFFIMKNQKLLENYNNKLEKDVKKRTKELKESNKKLKFLAEQDELTKTNNRRNFFTLGEEALEKANLSEKEIFVSMIDLDNFKRINDTYGHDVGDLVLKEFSSCIKKNLQDKHIFGRLGGEEFAIIFENISLDKAISLNEKIRKEVESLKIKNGENKISFTISIGLVASKFNNSLDVILKEADSLLYKAKSGGKNCIIRG